jgi:ABC-type lipoprotein export system ATPase subunit
LALIRDACAEDGAALLCVSHDRSVLERFERKVSLREINRVDSEAE